MRDATVWEVSIDTTRAGLERCMRALLLTGSTLTSHFRLSGGLGRGVSAFMLVGIPVGAEAHFDEIARPIDRRPAARVRLSRAGRAAWQHSAEHDERDWIDRS